MPASASSVRPRILVIRGGAIGDFILTLPALRLLREAFPAADLEIIGYRHIAALAEGRFYADAVRSIEYGPFAGFFARGGTLDPELSEYFGSFQQVVSYLFDPDGIFEANLRKAGVKHFLPAHVRIDDETHAARQLARPLESLALYLEDPAATVFPSAGDRTFAAEFLGGEAASVIAVHPGSGSPRKNWPLKRWKRLLEELSSSGRRVLVVGGEADRALLEALDAALPGKLHFARDLPLPNLAGVLERSALFIGHDSGISHLAAAVGTPCVLLFGPTDPLVWAPANAQVEIAQAPTGELDSVEVDLVLDAVSRKLAAPSTRA